MATVDRSASFRPMPGTAVHVRAKFAGFDFDGRGVVDPVHLKRCPESPLIAVRIEHPKGRRRLVGVAMSEILGVWEEKKVT